MTNEFGNMEKNDFNDLLVSTVLEGDAELLRNYLSMVANPDFYVNRIYDEIGEQKCTLLMIACLNGQIEIMRMLVEHFKPNIEALNNIRLEDVNSTLPMFFDVTVLWAAASIDNFEIVKFLVEHRANVNHTTRTNSTPLRGACYNGNVAMARYLIEKGADMSITKQKNETNLMVSVWHKRLEMVRYLVDELHFDVNECDADGCTSLYYAVNNGSLELVEYLLRHGARHFRAIHDQMTPLMWAAEKRHLDIVNIIGRQCSILEQIESEELLGSAFICIQDNNEDFVQAFEHFHRALELRQVHDLPRSLRLTTNEVFNHRQECQNLDELEEIRSNVESLYIEAFLVRERILGSANERYRYSIWYRGALLADDQQYDRTAVYWMYELELCKQHSISITWKHLRSFTSLFSEMLLESESISSTTVDILLRFGVTISEELEKNREDLDNNLHSFLFLITTISQFVDKKLIPAVDLKMFYQRLRSINRRHYTTSETGDSLLHLATNNRTAVNDMRINRTCNYPCLKTIRTLLQCGADVNAVNTARNTPLHVIASSQSKSSEAILELLLDAGAHFDYANAVGETPADRASNPILNQLIKRKGRLSLRCLCAQSIQKQRVLYHEKISLSLVSFVEKH